MTNVQDDQFNNSSAATAGDINDYQPEAVDTDQQSVADDTQAVVVDNNSPQPKPSKADVDELLSQLEALNREIAAKTVIDQPQFEEAKDQPEKLEAPLTPPALESSDDPQLPAGDQLKKPELDINDQITDQSRDVDLDKFINELEAKIAEKNEDDEGQQEPVVTPEEPKLSMAEEPKIDLAKEELAKQDDLIKEVIGGEEASDKDEAKDIEANFSRKRPSLDLSGISEEANSFQPAAASPVEEPNPTPLVKDEVPALTLNNGQLEEDQADSTSYSPLSPADSVNEEELINPEDLESQNIFTMLGLENLEEAEKEDFLADLEKLIWDNFIDVELPLLLNSQEKAQADQILADTTKAEDERKEALLVYLENIIPNLEEMMYKQALTLKKEMFEERVKKMREQATETNDLGLIADLDQIQDLIQAERYQTAVELLNKA